MTREDAIKRLEDGFDANIWYNRDYGIVFSHKWLQAYEMAISALREQEAVTDRHQLETVTNRNGLYTAHEVACIIAELFGDDCACNFNSIDEWLPEKCELQDACPNTVGVACWEQYLKYWRLEEV